MSEGFIVPKKPVNAGGGKGPWFRGATKVAMGEAIADEANNANLNPGTTAEAMVEGQASVSNKTQVFDKVKLPKSAQRMAPIERKISTEMRKPGKSKPAASSVIPLSDDEMNEF